MKPPSESPTDRVLFGGEELRGADQPLGAFVDPLAEVSRMSEWLAARRAPEDCRGRALEFEPP
jgi:hypothetical protein